MRADGQEKCSVSINKTKSDSIPSVHSYTPHLFLMWLQLFSMQRWMKRILSKILFLLLCFYFNLLRQIIVATHKFCGENNLHAEQLFLSAQFAQRTNFAYPAGFVIPLCSVNTLQKVETVETEIRRESFQPICIKLNDYPSAD